LFSRKVVSQEDGNIKVVQLKDVDDTFGLNRGKLVSVKLDKVSEDILLRKGDVLFKSKSLNHTASVFDADLPGPAVPTAHFFIVRPSMEGILPAYLAWFMNQRPAQQYFETVSAGSSVPIVNKKGLENLKIPIPSIRLQEETLEMYRLFLQEKSLMMKLMERRESLITGALLKAAEKYPARYA
jgi:restriction endonuclease S subunit